MIPGFDALSDVVSISAVADVRADALEEFRAKRPGVATFDSVEAMCASPDIEAVWISTPNQYHAVNAICAADNGKHVICEKPMAISVAECDSIVAAVERNNVKYVQGHSKAYHEPLAIMRRVIDDGTIGRPTQVTTMNHNDWLLRPSGPNERDTALGTGPLFRQGPHQVDIVRYLCASNVRSVRAVTGRHESAFPKTESNFTALLTFESGAVATLTFNAQGFFDASELTWGIGESGYRMLNADSVHPRERRTNALDIDAKQSFLQRGDPYGRGWQGGEDRAVIRRQPFFGITLVNCERGVMRQSPDGIFVYDAAGRRELPCPGSASRGSAEINALIRALEGRGEPLLDAHWGRETLRVCVAMLESSEMQREIVFDG